MHIRLSYANVVATLALVLSMGGGAALAANHYLISSTKQIKPSVLKKLTGKKGAAGSAGAPGVAGAPGAAGKEGPQGKEGVAGSAVAYAHVLGASNPAALLDSANSKNVSAITEFTPGFYCVSTTVPIKNVAGAADATAGDAIVTANFSVVAEAIKVKACPASTTVLVLSDKEGKTAAADFWVSFN